MSIGGDVLLTRANRQRHKIPIYNLTTGQPLPDVKGEGNLVLNFDNSAFHSLFPDAELAIVRIPRPPDRASPGEIAEHQARMRELVEQGIEIDGQRYYSQPPVTPYFLRFWHLTNRVNWSIIYRGYRTNAYVITLTPGGAKEEEK